jgi:hypothetical protein
VHVRLRSPWFEGGGEPVVPPQLGERHARADDRTSDILIAAIALPATSAGLRKSDSTAVIT